MNEHQSILSFISGSFWPYGTSFFIDETKYGGDRGGGCCCSCCCCCFCGCCRGNCCNTNPLFAFSAHTLLLCSRKIEFLKTTFAIEGGILQKDEMQSLISFDSLLFLIKERFSIKLLIGSNEDIDNIITILRIQPLTV